MKRTPAGYRTRSPVARRRQDGMALLIALIVLVVVSILGAVAMRTALFQNRVSINSQTNNLAFQAAESGLDAAVRESTAEIAAGTPITNSNHLFNKAVNIKPQRVCYTAGGITVDDKTQVRADGVATYTVACPTVANSNTSVTTVVGPAPTSSYGALEAFDVKFGGSLILIETRSYAEVPNTNVKAVHAQEWGIIGPSDSEGG